MLEIAARSSPLAKAGVTMTHDNVLVRAGSIVYVVMVLRDDAPYRWQIYSIPQRNVHGYVCERGWLNAAGSSIFLALGRAQIVAVTQRGTVRLKLDDDSPLEPPGTVIED